VVISLIVGGQNDHGFEFPSVQLAAILTDVQSD
jgi:hypothetical protein